MTATNAEGGAAVPVSIDTARKVQGGAAIPVYGYTAAPTDGRRALAGPAMPVRVLTAADLKQNGGQWTLEGRPYAMPVYTAPAGMVVRGGAAQAVYPVNSDAWPVPWYLAGGISASSCVIAYRSKGAASLDASYVNLARAGDNAAPGVAPTWSANTGWTFNGTTQFLRAGTAIAADNWSIFVQYAGLAAGSVCLVGCSKTVVPRGSFYVGEVPGNMIIVSGDAFGGVTNPPALATGNYGASGKQPYRNGIAEPSADTPGGGTGLALYIGASNNDGTAASFASVQIRAVAIYNATLTAPQALALAQAMAAL